MARIVGGEHDATHEQPGRRLREDGGLGVPPDPQGVLADDLVGEAVVRRHRRSVKERVVGGILRGRVHRLRERIEQPLALGGRASAIGSGPLELAERGECSGLGQARQRRKQSAALELGQPREPLLDALGQFAGRLAGEGQAEHLVAAHDAVRHQPHHPGRHRLGLAAAGPRDDESRRQRRLDDRGLLVRRGELAERGCDDPRRQQRRRRDGDRERQVRGDTLHDRHEALTAPTVWMRHSP